MKFILAFILGYLALIDCAIVRPAKRSSVCSTKACINKANEILSRMDTRANPCESFYNFACGNYIKAELSNTEISRSSLDQINKNLMVYISSVLKQPISAKDIEPIRDAKSYYQSCLKTDLVNRLSESYLTKFINDEFGGWPILNAYLGTPISVGSRLSSLQLMVKLEEYRVQPLLMLFVTNHPKNAKARVIKLKQPQLLPPQLVVNQQFQMAYLSYVKEFLMYLSPKAGFVADLEIAAMNELGNQLSMSGVNPVASQKAGYKNITIKQLQYYIPKFPWKDYIINGVFKTAGAKITENEHILVEDWDYLTKFADIFNVYSTFNKQTLDNFLIMSFVNSLAIDYMPFRYLQLKQNFMKLLTGVSQVQERGVYCATKTNSIMGFVTSRMFIDSYFDKNIKPKVKQMTDTIISALRDTLDQVTWMDVRSKKLAREKVDNIKARVAYPDNIFNNAYLDSLYEFDLDVDHFLKNGIKTTRVLTLEAYRDVSNPRDKEEWIAPPTFANAFYDPSSNQITLPAAVLSPPFYDENVPNYLNFGAIGSIIGHELTHGFDNAGRHFDKDGLFFFDSEMGLWSQKTIESYLNRTECMVNQYNHFKDAETNMNINGALTLNENIADNGGIKQAYNAYKKWIKANGEEPLLPRLDSYTQEQLFFISNAQAFCSRVRREAKMLLIRTDSHALAAFRVLGATSNMAEFGKAFNCKVGQTNNPAKKCTVW